MRSRSILQGVANVPITPTANSDNRMTNNITIKNVAYPSPDVLKEEQKSEPITENPYSEIKTREIISESMDAYLLNLYQTILLNDNKKLLINMISKNSIILTKEDLEEIIKRKTGKKCVIEFEEPELSCFGTVLYLKIVSIRIYDDENDKIGNDFRIKRNADYIELITNYHLNLDVVMVN